MPRLEASARRARHATLRPSLERLEARELMALNGHLDPTFGAGNGYVLTPVVPGAANCLSDYIAAVTEPDGSVLVDGPIGDDFRQFGVIHFKPDGSPDASFGTSGVATFALPPEYNPVGLVPNRQPSTILLQPDGKIVVVDVAQTGDFIPHPVTVVARFGRDGLLDPTFGTNGVATLDEAALGTPDPSLPYAAIQGDGKIVLAGSSVIPGIQAGTPPTQIASVRLTATGRLDATYGTNGLVTISNAIAADLMLPVPSVEDGRGVGIQPDGKIVILASFYSPNRNLLVPELVRIDADGSRDSSFSPNGITDAGILSPDQDGLLIQPNGEILLLGSAPYEPTDPADPFPAVLARLDADGSLEKRLSFQGATTSRQLFHPICFALQPDGKIFLAGFDTYRISPDPPLNVENTFDAFRVLSTLAFDPTFGVGGVSVLRLSQSTTSNDNGQDHLVAQAVAVGANDQGFVLGSSSNTPRHAAVLARLKANSATPGDFDGDGKADPALYLPSLGGFAISYTATPSARVIPFGGPGTGVTIPAPGDYTGSGRDEIAAYLPGLGIYAYRPAGGGPDVYVPIGLPGPGLTIPAPGDYYGTGRDDVAVYLADIGAFAVVDPSGQTAGQIVPFGGPGVGAAIPVPGDYDGSGKTEFAIYIPSLGIFAYRPAKGGPDVYVHFGGPGVGDVLPMPGDYDGSGRTEFAAYLPALGILVYRPAFGGPNVSIPFGGPGPGVALPAAADYTGSGKTEPGVYLPAFGELAYRPGGRPDVYIPFGIPGPGQTIPVTTTVLSLAPRPGSGPNVRAFAFSGEVPNIEGGLAPLNFPTTSPRKKAGGRSA